MTKYFLPSIFAISLVLLGSVYAAQETTTVSQRSDTVEPGGVERPAVPKITDWWAIVIAGLAFLLSIASLGNLVYFNEVSTRRTSRETHIRMLFDVDKILIDKPQLWAIYENHPLYPERDNSVRGQAERDAFIYQHLNIFDLVHNYYTQLIIRRDDDEDYWKSWDSYIRQFFNKSTDAKNLFRQPETQEVFSSDFVKYVGTIFRLR